MNPNSQQFSYPLDPVSKSVLALAILEYLETSYYNFVEYPYDTDVTLTVGLGATHYISLEGDVTIEADFPGSPGQHMWIILQSDGTGRVATFDTNMSSDGTLTGTANKVATIHFVSDGTKWYEASRTTGLTT